jgi:ElaB/YqjD/DUF883 family membrane-anchored ribosome-binding protein
MEERSEIKDKASELAERTQEKTRELQQQAGGRLRDQIASRSTQAGEQVLAVGNAIRQTSSQLRDQGQDAPARITDRAAQGLDSIGTYLVTSDPDRILADAEDFAARNPWAVAAGAAVVGFVASRFLKASSQRRYESRVTDLRPYEPAGTLGYEPRHASDASRSL